MSEKVNINNKDKNENYKIVNRYTSYADDIPVTIKYRGKQKQMLVPRSVDERFEYSGYSDHNFISGGGDIKRRLGGADVQVTLQQTFAMIDFLNQKHEAFRKHPIKITYNRNITHYYTPVKDYEYNGFKELWDWTWGLLGVSKDRNVDEYIEILGYTFEVHDSVDNAAYEDFISRLNKLLI